MKAVGKDTQIRKQFFLFIQLKEETRLDEQVQQEEVQKSSKKWIPIAIIAAVVIIAGVFIVQAFVLTSDKEDYFLAEKNTIDQYKEIYQERFEDELEWLDHAKNNATESSFDISAVVDDMSVPTNVAQIINNSTISIKTQMDRENEQASAALSASIADFELEGIEGYINSNDLIIGLPFLDEFLQLNGDDIGKTLADIDPASFRGEENINFRSILFEENVLPEEDLEYLQTEFVEYLYDQLPDDAFDSASETITVSGEELNTDKISFVLTEEQVQTILGDLFSKMAEDDRLQQVIIDQLLHANYVSNLASDDDIDMLLEEFNTSLQEAADKIDSLQLPNGFNSIIWVHDNVIVQRDLNAEIASDKNDDKAEISFTGSNLISEHTQTIEYVLHVKDQYSDETIAINGDLSYQDGEMNDSYTFSSDNSRVTLEMAKSNQEDGNTEFEYSLGLEENEALFLTIYWTGDATYESDQMSANHTIYADDGRYVNQDVASVSIAETGTTINEVEMPNTDQVRNLGEMSAEELIDYFENDVAQQFDTWSNELLESDAFSDLMPSYGPSMDPGFDPGFNDDFSSDFDFDPELDMDYELDFDPDAEMQPDFDMEWTVEDEIELIEEMIEDWEEQDMPEEIIDELRNELETLQSQQ